MKSIAYRAKGFMLPVAIFLLVTLAALVGYAMRLSLLAQMGTIQDVQGANAYLAARAGVEWAAFKVLAPGSHTMQACPATSTTLAINSFSVVVTCDRNVPKDKGNTQDIGIYTITSTASVGAAGAQDYIERQIKVTLSRCLYLDPAAPPGTVAEECN
jgi:MSHA biogenesis protein MshP